MGGINMGKGVSLIILGVIYIAISGTVLLTSDIIGDYYDNLALSALNTNISVLFLFFMEILPWGVAIAPAAFMLAVGLRELDYI